MIPIQAGGSRAESHFQAGYKGQSHDRMLCGSGAQHAAIQAGYKGLGPPTLCGSGAQKAIIQAGYKGSAPPNAPCLTSNQTANGRVSRAQMDATRAKISGPSVSPLAAMLMRRAN